MNRIAAIAVAIALGVAVPHAGAQEAPAAPAKPAFDAELAKKTGADEYGMRKYVLVILRTGPTPVADAEQRKAMFAGHMANIQRLAREGKLAVAGPFADRLLETRFACLPGAATLVFRRAVPFDPALQKAVDLLHSARSQAQLFAAAGR